MAKSTQTVDGYIADRRAPVRATLKTLRRLVLRTLSGATEGMKWGAPVFSNKNGKLVVYLYGGKDHAHLGFIHGSELDDPERILEGRGEAGRHVKLYPGKPLPERALKALLKQCADMV